TVSASLPFGFFTSSANVIGSSTATPQSLLAAFQVSPYPAHGTQPLCSPSPTRTRSGRPCHAGSGRTPAGPRLDQRSASPVPPRREDVGPNQQRPQGRGNERSPQQPANLGL